MKYVHRINYVCPVIVSMTMLTFDMATAQFKIELIYNDCAYFASGFSDTHGHKHAVISLKLTHWYHHW